MRRAGSTGLSASGAHPCLIAWPLLQVRESRDALMIVFRLCAVLHIPLCMQVGFYQISKIAITPVVVAIEFFAYGKRCSFLVLCSTGRCCSTGAMGQPPRKLCCVAGLCVRVDATVGDCDN